MEHSIAGVRPKGAMLVAAALLIPAGARGQHLAVASQDGPAVATLHDIGAGSNTDIFPYAANGGVTLAFGDVDGDSADDLLTGPGGRSANGPHVKAFRLDATPISKVSFYAYSTLQYGVNVAGTDLDLATTGEDEIVTGPGPGPVFGPHVRAFKLTATGMKSIDKVNFFAYSGLKNGVRVSGGDVDGEGHGDIMTNPALGTSSQLRGFSFARGFIEPLWDTAPSSGGYGVNAATGDIDGDSTAEILTAPGPDPVLGPHVRGWEYSGGGLTAINKVNFFAYSILKYGGNVSSGNLDADGFDEILVSNGPGSTFPLSVRGFNYDGTQISAMTINFNHFGAQNAGLNHAVAGFQ